MGTTPHEMVVHEQMEAVKKAWKCEFDWVKKRKSWRKQTRRKEEKDESDEEGSPCSSFTSGVATHLIALYGKSTDVDSDDYECNYDCFLRS